MSAPAFGWALERGCALKLRPSERLVLLYLADMANGERVCWPGQPLIERFTGLKNNTVRASINRLVELQLIRVEATLGKVTRYHILRPLTPSNGAGVAPAKQQGVAPSNGTGVYPLNQAPRPPQTGRPTPSKGHTDPSITQERDPRGRARAREAGKILSFGKKQEDAAPPSVQPATPGSDDFNTYLEAPASTKALPCGIEQDVIRGNVPDDPLDQPVDPGHALAVLAEVRHALRMRAYPPRAAAMSPSDMIDAVAEKPHIRPAHLPDAVLRLQRQQLAERAAQRA